MLFESVILNKEPTLITRYCIRLNAEYISAIIGGFFEINESSFILFTITAYQTVCSVNLASLIDVCLSAFLSQL